MIKKIRIPQSDAATLADLKSQGYEIVEEQKYFEGNFFVLAKDYAKEIDLIKSKLIAKSVLSEVDFK